MHISPTYHQVERAAVSFLAARATENPIARTMIMLLFGDGGYTIGENDFNFGRMCSPFVTCKALKS